LRLALIIGVFTAGVAAQDYLSAGVARIQAGDFQLGLMMLNEVVAAGSAADAATTARAHAYRAQAFLGLKRLDDARAAALLAVRADPGISITAPPHSAAAVELFAEVRRPVVAISPEVAGAAAEQEGKYQDAFAAYLAAYRALSIPVPIENDRRLREKIILLARRLEPPPPVPQEARAHFQKAQELIDAQALLGSGGTASLDSAAAELERAIRLAPWWAEPTFRLATVLQQLKRVDTALIHLNLARLAEPERYAKAPGASATLEPVAAEATAAARMASVFIYWPPQVRSTGRPKVYCDGVLVAELQKGRFIELAMPGGARVIKLGNKTETFTFDPGSTYYVRASQEGFTRWSPFTLQLISPNEGSAEFRDKSIAANEARRTYTGQCAVSSPKRK
jgi:tetratricopeptide (TPR) repeat protein